MSKSEARRKKSLNCVRYDNCWAKRPLIIQFTFIYILIYSLIIYNFEFVTRSFTSWMAVVFLNTFLIRFFFLRCCLSSLYSTHSVHVALLWLFLICMQTKTNKQNGTRNTHNELPTLCDDLRSTTTKTVHKKKINWTKTEMKRNEEITKIM